jgi:spore coat polysaccharide biosynthesis protein SpsF
MSVSTDGPLVGGVVLARMDSSRLPGKGLRRVAGRPMLSYVLERSRRIQGLARLILATSDRPVDYPLVEFAQSEGIEVFRGSGEDVASRVLAAAQRFGMDGVLRINGDSPLNDPVTQSAGVKVFGEHAEYDLVTNVFPRSFPVGMSMEVIRTVALERAYAAMSDAGHFEHVSKYIYEQSSEFCIHNISSGSPEDAQLDVAVDTPEDLARFGWMIGRMAQPARDWSRNEIIALAREYLSLADTHG